MAWYRLQTRASRNLRFEATSAGIQDVADDTAQSRRAVGLLQISGVGIGRGESLGILRIAAGKHNAQPGKALLESDSSCGPSELGHDHVQNRQGRSFLPAQFQSFLAIGR